MLFQNVRLMNQIYIIMAIRVRAPPRWQRIHGWPTMPGLFAPRFDGGNFAEIGREFVRGKGLDIHFD